MTSMRDATPTTLAFEAVVIIAFVVLLAWKVWR